MHSSNDIILKDISDLSERSGLISEQKSILIAMLSEQIPQSPSYTDILNLYLMFCRETDGLSLSDKICFCRAVRKTAGAAFADALSIIDADFSVPKGSRGKTAFVKNLYNEAAYKLFSSAISQPTPISYSSFEDCCDAVASDVCEFVILPIENSIDGKMFSFYSLLDQYDLRIHSVCNREYANDAKSIHYTLAGKPNIKHDISYANSTSKEIFEFSLSVDTDTNNIDITLAAALCSARIHRISTLPLSYNDTLRFYYSLAFSVPEQLKTFITYLCLEYPQYTPIGLYREI